MTEEKIRDLEGVSLYANEDGEVVARNPDGTFASPDSVEGSASSPSGSGRLKKWESTDGTT